MTCIFRPIWFPLWKGKETGHPVCGLHIPSRAILAKWIESCFLWVGLSQSNRGNKHRTNLVLEHPHTVLGRICIRLRKRLESEDWMPIAVWIFWVWCPDWCHDLNHYAISKWRRSILWRSFILARLPFISVVFLCGSYCSKKQLDGRYETKVEAR